ncbi:xylose isomerase-like protein [Stachybotrys elegans]|uniref:Xylose isomerase-like protein n=1 Tax=Stachybotrys elegans TaxID=80388 RepID=A0A8K0T219_9HYPO|nr:xylose isomerase-like protein [Stachybotrys elegans]
MAHQPEGLRPAIATMSLGTAGIHPLKRKLQAAQGVGFRGIELFWDDLLAETHETGQGLLKTAQSLRSYCDNLGLEIISLQPFRNYDGIRDKELHDQRVDEFKAWLMLAGVLGAGFIGVPSTIKADEQSHTGDAEDIARDLAELAALARPYNIRIAYENLCFGAHVRTWQQAWEAISHPLSSSDVGFLVDTFNLAGSVYADPSIPDGKVVGGIERFRRSLDDLVGTIPMSRIPFIQLADGERMTAPIGPDHEWMNDCLNAKMAWSRNARLFPFEPKGYLPVLAIVKALVRAGWSGWVSMEVFSRSTAQEGEETMKAHAKRAWRSWQKMATLIGDLPDGGVESTSS